MQRCSFLFARFIALPRLSPRAAAGMLDDTRVWANANAYCLDTRGPMLFEQPRVGTLASALRRWLASCKTIAQRPWPSPPACLNAFAMTPTQEGLPHE
jgi:hypothetical protein